MKLKRFFILLFYNSLQLQLQQQQQQQQSTHFAFHQ